MEIRNREEIIEILIIEKRIIEIQIVEKRILEIEMVHRAIKINNFRYVKGKSYE